MRLPMCTFVNNKLTNYANPLNGYYCYIDAEKRREDAYLLALTILARYEYQDDAADKNQNEI